MKKILLVEDDEAIVTSLTDFLAEEGFTAEAVSHQAAAVKKLQEESYQLALLDISLAGGSGFNVCAEAKKAGLPVIFLTATAEESSVVKGLDMGADDYIVKPFRPRELLSRINNVLRHYRQATLVTIGSLTVDTDRGTASKGGKEISLSALEYRILLLFLNNRGLVITRNKLLEDIWDIAGDFVNDNTLTVYIKRLREKIEDDPAKPEIIKTVRGIGYRMD